MLWEALRYIWLYFGDLRLTIHKSFIECSRIRNSLWVQWPKLRRCAICITQMLLVLPNILHRLVLVKILRLTVSMMIILLNLTQLDKVNDIIIVLREDSFETILSNHYSTLAWKRSLLVFSFATTFACLLTALQGLIALSMGYGWLLKVSNGALTWIHLLVFHTFWWPTTFEILSFWVNGKLLVGILCRHDIANHLMLLFKLLL
jgi:hypothetical protein